MVDKTLIDEALENPELEVQHGDRRTRYAGADDLIRRREYLDELETKAASRGKPRTRFFRFGSGLFNR